MVQGEHVDLKKCADHRGGADAYEFSLSLTEEFPSRPNYWGIYIEKQASSPLPVG